MIFAYVDFILQKFSSIYPHIPLSPYTFAMALHLGQFKQ